jgi:hypothetical protein
MNSIFPLLVALLLVWADDKPQVKPQGKPAKEPEPKLPLGKDTTYVTGPLDKHGYIDYEAALNAELSRGVTRDNNANVLLIKAFGPAPEGGNGLPIEYFKWLDIDPLPKDGDYFLSLYKIAREKLSLNDNQLNAINEQQSWSTQRPWSAKDYTVVAEWLKVNEKPLALVVEAMKRPEYFNPLVTGRVDGERGSLIGALLPSVQKCRELATALTSRAMLRVHEGKYDEAWQDLLACHRLGRFSARGCTLIESLVGIAICQIAHNSTLAYIENAKLTSKQALDRLKDLERLPPIPSLADKINTGERFMGLDSLQLIRRGGNVKGLLDGSVFDEKRNPTEEELKVLEKMDWDTAFRNVNKWYNEISTALRVKDRAEREKAFDKLDELFLARKKDVSSADYITELLKKGAGADKRIGKEVALAISDVLMGLLAPAVRKVQNAHDRVEQVNNNLKIAFALAAYRADHDRYPAKLDDLAPKYLAAVPNDLFTGKALVYKPSEKGYLFYSFGPNGKDDEGRWYDDTPPGDDPRVKMPLPPLKKGE